MVVDFARNSGRLAVSKLRSWISRVDDDIYRNLKTKAEQTGDSLIDYALICPALYLVDEAEVQRLLARREGKDQFLYKQARKNLDVWRKEIAKRLRSRR